MKKTTAISAALLTAISIGTSAPALAEKGSKEKCYWHFVSRSKRLRKYSRYT